MNHIIGIGEYRVSANREDCLKTYALASCVAVTLYSPLRKIAGMIHVALPDPFDEEESRVRPGYYATSGVPLLFNVMCTEFGCQEGELLIHLYGGAGSIRKKDYFNIGRRNLEAVYKILSGRKLTVHHREVGGTISRTLEMDVATRRVKVFSGQLTI